MICIMLSKHWHHISIFLKKYYSFWLLLQYITDFVDKMYLYIQGHISSQAAWSHLSYFLTFLKYITHLGIFWRILFYSKIIDVMCGNARSISISQTKTFWRVIRCDGNDTILLSTNNISTYYLFWNRLTCCVSSLDNRQDSIMCILGQAVMSYDTFDMYVCSSVIFFSSSHPRFAHWCILSPKSCNISQSSYCPQRGLLLGIYNFEKSQIR